MNPPSYFKFVPLGGVGEIGSNMVLVHDDTQGFIVDMGILFPNDDFFGINYLVPDVSMFSHLEIKNVLFTHGHEDHIGAVKFFIKVFPNVTFWASPFCASLIRHKLNEVGIKSTIKIFHDFEEILLNNLSIVPIPLNHSIPETYGFIIRDTIFEHALFYASDFKIDLTPQYEKKFDIKKLKSLLSQSKHISLFIDSTNINSDDKTLSESELLPEFQFLLNEHRNRRIFITLFSSNVYRLRNIFSLAKSIKINITIIGRSVHHYINSALENGHLDSKQTNYSDLENNPDPQAPGIFILSGCQGDYLSTFRRFCLSEIKLVKPQKGDVLIYSSKIIPGNEKKVFKLFNALAEKDVTIITDKDRKIHASGHPGKPDLSYLLTELSLNANYFPIHGETTFLKTHVSFIKNNFPNLTPHYINNFSEVTFGAGKNIKISTLNPTLPLLIHGSDTIIEREKISERRKLATNGLIILTIERNRSNIHLESMGLPISVEDSFPGFEADILKLIHSHIQTDNSSLEEAIRIKSRRYFEMKLGYRPIVFVKLV